MPMPNPANLVSALGLTGLGASLGGIVTSFIQTRSAKGESRANAADMLTRGYGGFADRLDKANQVLSEQNRLKTGALIELTDIVDELLAKESLKGCACQEFRAKVRIVNNKAKMLT
jgi:hypothetical protein